MAAPPSETAYVFGTMNAEYAFGKLVKKLSDPGAVPEETIVLKKGVDVTGIALGSDGKPAAGWTIVAMPEWWAFGVSPSGATIAADGSFTLPHVDPGKFDVRIGVPTGKGMTRVENVANGITLPPAEGKLKVATRIPSPQSMVAISGVLKFSGGEPKKSISVDVVSEDREQRGSANLQPGETEFHIEPLPPGRYTLSVTSTEVEELRIPNVTAPTKGLEVPVKVSGQPQFVGQVIDDAGNPVTQFRVRVIRVGYLRGPGYVQDSQWRDVDTVAGEFTVDLVGPGIYQATVAADGFAIARSEPVNTDTMGAEPITVKLTRGVEIRGIIVDEQGQPIDGATVAPLSASTSALAASAGPRPRTAIPFTGSEGAVKSSKGVFQLALVPAGTEMLRVTHPEYCFAFSSEIAVGKENIDLKPIVLTRGGTVRGTVYDADGKPEPNVSIILHDRSGYGGTDDELAGRLATAVTDKNGEYEVRHLPSQLCNVHRAEEWNANGVVRTAVLPANGEVRTLDFGGPHGVTGRLLVNGQPVANMRVQLGGISPHFGVLKAYAATDADGRFTFARPPAGRRTLWRLAPGRRSDWLDSGEVMIDDTTTDLGEINARAAVVTISVTGLSPAELGAARVRS